jgi:hypothetical protein
MMPAKQLWGRAMNDDDEIWDDEKEPAGSNEQYDAMLVDVQNHSCSYGCETFQAMNDGEGIVLALQWAMAECQKIGKKALLIVTGGSIHGSHSEVIEP